MNAPTKVSIPLARPRRSPASLIKLGSDVASFYGFKPLRATNFSAAAATLAGSLGSEPSLAFWASASPAHLPSGVGAPRELGEFGLGMVGTPDNVSEIMLLKTLSTIITEWGAPIARVRVNALGDKDSKLRFARELTSYLRRHSPELDEACRALLGGDPLAALVCQTMVSREVIEGGPKPMNFLSEKSRVHFKQVLEHLESLGLPYELDDMLVDDERDPRILFAIDLADQDSTIVQAVGGRFDDYLRRVTGRKEGAGAAASIFFRKKGLDRAGMALPAPKRAPKIFFVQLGLRAKLEGLRVLEVLRAARIPVLQSFSSTQLGPQLASARAAGVNYLLIMGAREVLDGTVLVRAMNNNSQEAVPLSQLPRY